MIEKLLEIIDEVAEELGLLEDTTLGLNAIESELLFIEQTIEKHINTPSLDQGNI